MSGPEELCVPRAWHVHRVRLLRTSTSLWVGGGARKVPHEFAFQRPAKSNPKKIGFDTGP